ncbi:hypothetical protein ACFXJ5_19540 [Streptomyces sp. NPDC059373]
MAAIAGTAMAAVRLPLPGAHLSVSGLLAVAVAMMPGVGRWITARRENRVLATALLLWFVGQMASNMWAGVPIVRAVLNALVFPTLVGAGAFVLSRLAHGSASRVAGLAVLASAAYCVFLAISPTEYFEQDPWKYGVGIPATIVVFVAVGILRRKGHSVLALLLPAGLAAFHLALGFRSLAGICLVATAMLIARRADHKLTIGRAVLMTGVCLLAIWVSATAYSAAVERGWLGEEQYQKQLYQSQVDGGYLVASRPEMLMSTKLIAEQPLLGRGADVIVSPQEQRDVVTVLYERGVNISLGQQRRLFENGTNSHSLGLGSWVRGGVLGFLPWAYILFSLYRTVLRRWQSRNHLLYPLAVFMTFMMTWDFLFSPWAPGYEIVLGIAWSVVLGVSGQGEADCEAG